MRILGVYSKKKTQAEVAVVEPRQVPLPRISNFTAARDGYQAV